MRTEPQTTNAAPDREQRTTSDAAQFLALATHDRPAAHKRLDHLLHAYAGMIQSYVEWCLAWSLAPVGCDEANRTATVELALQRWIGALPFAINDQGGYGQLRKAMHAANTGRAEPRVTRSLLLELRGKHRQVHEALATDRDPASAFLEFQTAAKRRHDVLVRLVQELAAAFQESLGQSPAVDRIRETLDSCSFHEPFWEQIEGMSPAERVEFLAAEFRAHWSGLDREGTVEIIEDENSFRLVLDPCGSGGALRRDARRQGRPLAVIEEGNSSSWGRAGCVPLYCVHCAQNEQESYRRLGYLAWSTEFDPDPDRPCTWIVYKRAEAVPRECYRRLGFEIGADDV